MALIGEHAAEGYFSSEAVSLIAGARRKSTLRTYSQRLAPYYAWCDEKNGSPTRASVPLVTEFPTEKFQARLQRASVTSYKSAILSIYRGFEDGSTINADGYLSLRLDGMFNERPPKWKVILPRDPNTVLDYLKGHPFEPLSKAMLKYVTLRTAFLLGVGFGTTVRSCTRSRRSASVFTNTGAMLFSAPCSLA